ncbi:MAG TPA: 16S rRNA (adenine(1518)-N(6)/adenine(1519)-N(6))-dimethyltransferase RsmA, partial [Gammaproteobacteria bacterium]|nr:16S rRNA (adenine(1518)-N(6)/adenine(1519)-N(6))-dimethyltransferase RsmA [Gammaproteobacteria bacterium]
MVSTSHTNNSLLRGYTVSLQKGNGITIKAKKRFGQNFLVDSSVIDKIVRVVAPLRTDNLLEIGPGKGAMTTQLLEHLDKLHVIEIDRDLIKLLNSFRKDNLVVHQGDILKFDVTGLPKPLRIVGNLPYNISSPILFHLLDSKSHIEDMTFMLQREVVERIVAKSGNKTYGRLSVMIQAFFEVEMIFTVPPESFEPAPKIDSAIIYLKP